MQVFAVIDFNIAAVSFFSVDQPLVFSPSLSSKTCCVWESTAEGGGEGERERKRERKREKERERGNEGWCKSLSGCRKEAEKITRFGIFFEVRPKSQNSTWSTNGFNYGPQRQLRAVSGSFHPELLTKTDWSSFSCREEPANYQRRHDVSKNYRWMQTRWVTAGMKSGVDAAVTARKRQKLVLMILKSNETAKIHSKRSFIIANPA